jgi:membrane protease YdiL (CAAX protease family)
MDLPQLPLPAPREGSASNQGIPGREPPDRGTPRSGLIALVSSIVLYAILAISQNLPAVRSTPEPIADDAPAQTVSMAKFFLLLEEAMNRAGSEQTTFGRLYVQQIDAASSTPPKEQLAGVLADAEAQGPTQGGMRLRRLCSNDDRFRKALAESEVLKADAQAIGTLLEEGDAALSDEQRVGLIDRYGWLARVVMAGDDTAMRDRLYADAGLVLAFAFAGGLLLLLIGVSGTVLLIVAIVAISTGRLRPQLALPAPGGSVFLETLAVFLACFLLVQVMQGVVLTVGGTNPGDVTTVVALNLQWLVVLTIFWPLLRGVSFSSWRHAVGWTAGRSVPREIACGVIGYLAGFPLFIAGGILAAFLSWFATTKLGIGGPPHNPVIDLVQTGGPLIVVSMVLLATCWAPLVEETIFRGGVLRHLGSKWGIPLAAVVSALLFAFLHGYGPFLAPPVIALGLSFAVIRWWRGSLVACMTAHFLHNAVSITLTLVGIKLLG